jgi:hypothetical protein
MIRPPRTTIDQSLVAKIIAGSGVFMCLCCNAVAQNFTSQAVNNGAIGFSEFLPIGDGLDLSFGSGPGIKGGMAYGIAAETIYDSNFLLSENDPKSELTTTVTPWVNYRTDPEGGAPFSVVANYRPVVQTFLENSNLNGINQSGDLSMQLQGSKTIITAFGNYVEIAATDPILNQFVSGSFLNGVLTASYQIAPRTTLFASGTVSISEFETAALEGAKIYTTAFGAIWAATERLKFGPAIRYTTASSDNTGDLDAMAFSIQGEYKVGERIQIIGSLGLEYTNDSRSTGSGRSGLTGGLVANYAITDRLAWTNSVQYVTVPSPSEQNFVVNNLSISTALFRELLHGNVGAGLSMNVGMFEGVGPVGVQLEDEKNYGVFVTYRRKFFLERLEFDSRVRYLMNNGNSDWSQVQVSAALRLQF